MRRLAKRLREQGQTVVTSAEPGGTAIGTQIRSLLLDARNHSLSPTAELLLYFACRAQNVDELIVPALTRGDIVLSDRFTDSTRAYQGEGRGLGQPVVDQLDRIAARGLQPDLTLVIDVDLETSLARAHARTAARQAEDRIEQQSVEFHQSVREAYLRLAADEPSRMKLIDGRSDPDTVAERIWGVVITRLPSIHA